MCRAAAASGSASARVAIYPNNKFMLDIFLILADY